MPMYVVVTGRRVIHKSDHNIQSALQKIVLQTSDYHVSTRNWGGGGSFCHYGMSIIRHPPFFVRSSTSVDSFTTHHFNNRVRIYLFSLFCSFVNRSFFMQRTYETIKFDFAIVKGIGKDCYC